jgi:hypothetical protein
MSYENDQYEYWTDIIKKTKSDKKLMGFIERANKESPGWLFIHIEEEILFNHYNCYFKNWKFFSKARGYNYWLKYGCFPKRLMKKIAKRIVLQSFVKKDYKRIFIIEYIIAKLIYFLISLKKFWQGEITLRINIGDIKNGLKSKLKRFYYRNIFCVIMGHDFSSFEILNIKYCKRCKGMINVSNDKYKK